METKIDLDKVCEFVKQAVQDIGDAPPFIIMRAGEASYEMTYADTENSDKFLKDLKAYVEDIGCVEYYSAFLGYSKPQNPDFLFNELRSLQTEEDVKSFCENLLKYHFTKPSRSNNKTEVLIVTKHHKTNGMDTRLYEVFRDEEEIEFSDANDVTNKGTVQNKWDVWNKKQLLIK